PQAVVIKQGDKTENKDKGKSPIITITGFRDLNVDTNDFSAAGPFNTAADPTAANTSDMLNLEDLTHSNDTDDVVARIEAIRMFLAYASFMGFLVYQMDVKSAFLYGTIEEEVYICQPPGFEDPENPDKVYKVVKALYRLHQSHIAWYETLATYLLENGFQRGTIDQTLFIKKQQKDILLVQIYVDNIIFGAINKALCQSFEKLMKDKFQMSSMGELTFFLGLQDSPFDLVAYSDSDYAGASLDRKSTTGGCQFFGCRLISWQCKKQTIVATSSTEAEYVAAASGCCYLRNVVIEIDVLNILSDALPITSNAEYNIGVLLHNTGSRVASWLVQKQMALGKDTSNPLIVNNLLKTIWYSIHHHLTIEVLAIPGQTATGVNTPRSDEDRLKLMELIVFLLQKDVCVGIGITAARLSSYCCQANISAVWLLHAAEGVKQIIDFLSASYIHYALTVNPHIYISCIKQFWNTASVKRSGDVTRLQALVDKKKIVISEVVIREILQLDDAEGVVCLPNEEIFVGLTQMGYEKPSTKLTFYKALFSSQWKFLIHTILQSLSAKRTSWNEFSTEMASAVICLSTGQKFNFSKYIFDSLVRNVDSSSKFYMYPRFIQLIIQNQENVAEDVSHDAIPSPLSHEIPSPSQDPFSPPQQPQSSPQAPPQGADLPTHIQQILDVCSALTRRVENLENDKADQKLEIIKLKARVKKLEMANKVKSSKLRHLRKVGASRRVESSDDIEDIFNQGRMIDDMDKDEGIELVKDADIAESEGRHAAKQAENQAEIYHIDLDHSSKVLNVVTAASQVSAASTTISAAKPSIPVGAPTVVAAYTRRKGVIIRDPEEELSSKTPAETPNLKDKGKGILIETPKPIKKKDQIELDAEYAKKLHEEINKDYEEFNKDIDWDAAMDHVNQKSKNP
nr:putative ribonuclease H-like domain-containing protein [Tanacetum cinerariifolium]